MGDYRKENVNDPEKDVAYKKGSCGGKQNKEKGKGEKEKVEDPACHGRDRLYPENIPGIGNDKREGKQGNKRLKVDSGGELGKKRSDKEEKKEKGDGNSAAAHCGVPKYLSARCVIFGHGIDLPTC